MPYCVNCGVQLSDKARVCPLCQTEVIIPESNNKVEKPQAATLQTEIIDDTFDRKLWIKIISITLFSPSLIAVLVDWIFQNGITWSLYVTSSMLFVWIWSVSLLLFKQNRFQKWLPIAWLSLLGFLFTIENLTKTQGWFFTIGLPIVTALFLLILVISYLIRKSAIRELHIPAFIVIGVGLFCFVINGSISLYNLSFVKLDWSLIVMTTCIAFASLGFVLQQKPHIVERIKHWFHV